MGRRGEHIQGYGKWQPRTFFFVFFVFFVFQLLYRLNCDLNNGHSVCGGVSRVVAQCITHPTLTLSDTKLSEQYFRRSLFPSPFAPTHPSYAATIVSRSESPLARFNLASCAASRRLNGATNGSRWETAAATVRTGSRQLKMA